MPALDSFAAFIDAFLLKGSAVRAYLWQRSKQGILVYAAASRGLSEDGRRTSLAVLGQIAKNLIQPET